MKWFYFAFFGFSSFTINSQSITTDRPDQTESSSTLSKGYFQIETGSILEITSQTNNWLIQTNLFRYGVTNDLEFRLVTELKKVKNRANNISTLGLNDTQFGLKYRFINKGIELSFLGHLIIPSGTDGFDASQVGISNKILLSHNLSESISVGYNVGYDYFDSESHGVTYSIAFGIGLTEKIGFFSEFYGNWEKTENFFINYDHGFTYLIGTNLQIDFSMGFGITEKSNIYSAGLSWRLPN